MECLVILLYCFNVVEFGFSPGLMDFALPYAINLAEAGKTIEQKRIGKWDRIPPILNNGFIFNRLFLLC